jgi:hypothetical protein
MFSSFPVPIAHLAPHSHSLIGAALRPLFANGSENPERRTMRARMMFESLKALTQPGARLSTAMIGNCHEAEVADAGLEAGKWCMNVLLANRQFDDAIVELVALVRERATRETWRRGFRDLWGRIEWDVTEGGPGEDLVSAARFAAADLGVLDAALYCVRKMLQAGETERAITELVWYSHLPIADRWNEITSEIWANIDYGAALSGSFEFKLARQLAHPRGLPSVADLREFIDHGPNLH